MLYEMTHDEQRNNTYHISCIAKWCMPGVYCDVCDSHWSSSGIVYPAIDLTATHIEKMLRSSRRKGWNVPFDEYIAYRDVVAKLLPQGALLEPGTDFGPMQGTANGIFCDISWCLWTPFVHRHIYEQFIENGINMPTAAPHELQYKGKQTPPDFLLMQIPYYAKLSPICFSPEPPCIKCGRQGATAPQQIVIERSSIPNDTDLCYGRDFPALLFVTERFVEVALKLEISGCKFVPVDIT